MATELGLDEPLKFIVAPHIVQDLGLNLYTDLPRILVEFVANAYDADAPKAEIFMDVDAIRQHRRILRADWDAEKERAKLEGKSGRRLAELTISENVTIEIKLRGLLHDPIYNIQGLFVLTTEDASARW